MAVLNLTLPVLVQRRLRSKVKVFREWEDKALVQTLLIEKERLLEGCKVAGDPRRSGKDNTGLDDVLGI